MVSIHRISLVASVILLLGQLPVRAEQTLKVFEQRDFQLTSTIDFVTTNRVMPLYGGSDQSGFTVQYDVNNPSLIPIFSFDLREAQADQVTLVGMVQHQSMQGAGLVLSAGDHLKSSLALDSDGSGFQFFSLPMPKGFTYGQLTLSFQSPNVVGAGNSVAFANVRLIRGEPSKSTSVVTPPMPANSEPAAVMDGMAVEVVHEFSGNDFDSHLFESDGPHPAPVTVSSFTGGATAEILVEPVGVLRSIPILSVDDPPITQFSYAIAGQVYYGGVDGENEVDGYGYLEMWSDFADGSSYFTRTLAGSGLLRQIRGRSGPRPFLLPFNAGNKRPTRIRMNLVMSGRGTVTMTDLKLMQYVKPAAAAVARNDSTALFNPRLLWIPVGVLPMFALIALMEPLVRRGKGRWFVLIWTWIFFALAELSIAWGMAAWGHGLSLREVGPMLLASVLILGCTLFTVPRMSRRYRDAELRRMQLMDIA